MGNTTLQKQVSRSAKHLAAGAVAALVFLAVGSTEALARPTVTVAEFSDSTRRGKGARARVKIVEALQADGQVDLLPWSRVVATAASQRIKAATLTKPVTLGRVAKDAGADIAVKGSVRRAGKVFWLEVQIIGATGRELWSKEVELERGELSTELAARFAAAIAAAAGTRGGAANPPVAQEIEQPEQPAVREIEASENPEEGMLGIEVDRSRRRRPSDGEPGPLAPGEIEESGRDSFGSASSASAPPFIDFTLAYTMSWRKYRWCPEVEECDQPSPSTANSLPLRYSTDTPYSGVLLKADLFPFRDLIDINALRGIGVSGGINWSPSIATSYTDEATGEPVSLGSSQHRWSVEGIYRYYYGVGSVAGWAGLRVGYSAYGFSIDENPKLTDSTRGGFIASLDLAIGLASTLRLEARGALLPWSGPGEKEKALYGVAAAGGGYNGTIGLTSDFGHPEWHVGAGAYFDFAHFGDRYKNYEGEHPEFGRATEDYLGISLGVKATY